MRLVVGCVDCRRQYDATGREISSRFRCLCGVVLVVEAAKAHASAVVRCSSCGAARSGGGSACGHCGADFTLHERDLQSVCSSCATRISGSAKFCHSCGTAVLIEEAVGQATEFGCPACGDEHRLSSRALGPEVSMLECGRCAGMWLARDVFEHVTTRAEEVAVAVHGLGVGPARASVSPVDSSGGRVYRPCIKCGTLMNRTNYGRRSNIIVDVCKEHGVWFDADELGRILAWIRGGGLDQMRELEKTKLRDEKRRAAMASHDRSMMAMGASTGDNDTDALSSLLRLLW